MRKSSFLVCTITLFAMAFCFFQPSTAQAQLDIFEKKRDKPPERGRGFSFGPIRLGGSSGRKQVIQGNTLYEKGNYAAASLKYFHALKNMGFSRWRQTAQYQMAISLYRLGLYRPAMKYLADIIGEGRNHAHFAASLSWALVVNKKLQNPEIFLSKMKKFRPEDLPAKSRDQLFYLLGKYYFLTRKTDSGRLQKALDLLNRVKSRKPVFYSKANYIIGVSYDIDNQPNQAFRSFSRAGKAARRIKDKKNKTNLYELAVLSIARILYGAKHFSKSIAYYNGITRSSARWTDALFESSWAYLRLGRYEEALGILHTLDSPYYRNEFYPETGIIRAYSFFQRCRYKDVKKIVVRYKARYQPLLNTLTKFIGRYQNRPAMLFQELRRMQTREEGGSIDKADQMFQRILKLSFRDKKLRRLFSYIKELGQESELIRQSSSVWKSSSLARTLQKQISSERLAKVKAAGNRALSRFRIAKKELRLLISQALRLKYETLGAEKSLLRESARQSGKKKGKQKKREFITVSVHEDFIYWPFRGEYWVDEAGYYCFCIRGECIK